MKKKSHVMKRKELKEIVSHEQILANQIHIFREPMIAGGRDDGGDGVGSGTYSLRMFISLSN